MVTCVFALSKLGRGTSQALGESLEETKQRIRDMGGELDAAAGGWDVRYEIHDPAAAGGGTGRGAAAGGGRGGAGSGGQRGGSLVVVSSSEGGAQSGTKYYHATGLFLLEAGQELDWILGKGGSFKARPVAPRIQGDVFRAGDLAVRAGFMSLGGKPQHVVVEVSAVVVVGGGGGGCGGGGGLCIRMWWRVCVCVCVCDCVCACGCVWLCVCVL